MATYRCRNSSNDLIHGGRWTHDSVVLTLAACTHVQSTALPLSTSELTVVKITDQQEKLVVPTAGVPFLAIPYTKSAWWMDLGIINTWHLFHKYEPSRTKHMSTKLSSSGMKRRTACYINIQVSKEYGARIFRWILVFCYKGTNVSE